MKAFLKVTLALLVLSAPYGFCQVDVYVSPLEYQGEVPRLSVGDPAPPLPVTTWVKGDGFDRFHPGRVYVVEFWATWCGPCRKSIPHMAQIQEDYLEQGVVVVGVAAAETEGAQAVHNYLDAVGPVVNYAVAYVEDEGETYSRWVRAGRGSGLPWVFLVDRQGKIAWWGQPFYPELAKKLRELVYDHQNGTAPAAEKRDGAKAEEGWLLQRSFWRAIDEKEWTAALKMAEELINLDAQRYWFETATKFRILLLDLQRRPESYEFGRRLIDDLAQNNPSSMDLVAGWILTGAPDQPGLALAEEAAERAVQLTGRKNAEALARLANVQERAGRTGQARKTREEALQIADASVREQIQNDSRRGNPRTNQ